MAYESGGSGLWSTLDDYLNFARLFVGDGKVDGVRLLGPETLATMMTNQLTESQRANSGWLGRKPFAVGRGFGLGVSVVLETDKTDLMRRGSVGTVSWPGAYGGWWQADPLEGSVLIFLAHNMVEILHHFRVTLDYPHDRLILEPFETLNVPETDMSGITWESEPPDHTKLVVVRVQDDSPAADAGVKVGDVLGRLNDRPAAEMRKWQVTEALKRPGGEVMLLVKRGEKEIPIRFVLRRLL